MFAHTAQNACFFCISKFWRMQGPSCSPPVLGIHVYLCIKTCTHMQMYVFTYLCMFAHAAQNACFCCIFIYWRMQGPSYSPAVLDIHVCLYIEHEHTRTCICLPACKQMFTHIFAYAGPFVLSYIWYIFISVYVHMYAHAGVYMYTHINIHTNYMYVYA